MNYFKFLFDEFLSTAIAAMSLKGVSTFKVNSYIQVMNTLWGESYRNVPHDVSIPEDAWRMIKALYPGITMETEVVTIPSEYAISYEYIQPMKLSIDEITEKVPQPDIEEIQIEDMQRYRFPVKDGYLSVKLMYHENLDVLFTAFIHWEDK